MKAFLEKLEIKASYQEVRVLFARIDFNLTGSLTFSEFMDRITNWKKFGKEWEKKAMQAKAQAKKKVTQTLARPPSRLPFSSLCSAASLMMLSKI
jgi:hypothetical protein